MIMSGCAAFAQVVGPTRIETELLPQWWEQVGGRSCTADFSPSTSYRPTDENDNRKDEDGDGDGDGDNDDEDNDDDDDEGHVAALVRSRWIG